MKLPDRKEIFKRLKRIALAAVLAILLLVNGLVLLLIIGGIILLFFQGSFQNTAFLTALSLFFAIFLGLSAIIVKVNRKFNIITERKPTRADLKMLGYLAVALVGQYVFISAADYYFKLFPTTISRTLTMEILRTLIQTNGFLIGFSGIVFAQMFWAIHNQQSGIQMEILKAPTAQISAQTSTQETSNDIRRDTLKILERKRTIMIIFMLVVMNAFVISILLSLSSMSQTETLEAIPIDPYVKIPFWSMSIAIIIFAFVIAQSKMSVSEEDIKEMREKSKKGKTKG